MDTEQVLANAGAAIKSGDLAKIQDALVSVQELAEQMLPPTLEHTRLRDKKSLMRDHPLEGILENLRDALGKALAAELDKKVRQRVAEVGAPQPAFDYSKNLVVVFESGYSISLPFSENNCERILSEIRYTIANCGGVGIKEIYIRDAD